MQQSIYEPLRDNIAKVVTDVMKLQFGCKYWVKTRRTEKPFMILHASDIHTAQALVDIEVIGRDVTLADVLRAIFAQNFGAHLLSAASNPKYWQDKVLSKWDLALPLHEQSDELGELLVRIIK